MADHQSIQKHTSSGIAPLLLRLPRELRDMIYDCILTKATPDKLTLSDPYDVLIGFPTGPCPNGPWFVDLPGKHAWFVNTLHYLLKDYQVSCPSSDVQANSYTKKSRWIGFTARASGSVEQEQHMFWSTGSPNLMEASNMSADYVYTSSILQTPALGFQSYCCAVQSWKSLPLKHVPARQVLSA
jgi:hypothetical protein